MRERYLDSKRVIYIEKNWSKVEQIFKDMLRQVPWCTRVTWLQSFLIPISYHTVPGIDNLRKNIINYYLEEYFGIDIQMKVLGFEF
jgi:hypothetical protein